MASSPLARNCGHFFWCPQQRSLASRRHYRRRPPTKSVSAPRGSIGPDSSNAPSKWTSSPTASPSVAGGEFLLVDDVLTTGATVRAAATALREAGAIRVEVITLARAFSLA
ncbi:ComF family protein [Archangium lansingense]|uniref:Phosphoribosyltransferase family protein n=1 Tax=Archangium lansingense TaxID=2995310 RepID=A0ABT4AAQ9_9BACT|nr:phosphoribosyltransferase family protein [Archangium lansinium]MCY1078751.1 phosphoribosyltransferase family protein [Archangium lansinium]